MRSFGASAGKVLLSLGLAAGSGCLVIKIDGIDSVTDVSLSDILTDGATLTSTPTEPTTDTDTTMAPSICGDGAVEGAEACDDGNQDNSDGCLDTCVLASCGDGFVQVGVEACDDGNQSNSDACLNTCVLASCGDGFVQVGVEQCDDGNDVPGDGCDQCFAGDLPAECQGVTVLQEASRSVNSSGEVECDQDLPAEGRWSRFSGPAGVAMPLSAPPPFACGTHAPGWLKGALPGPAEGIVARDVCFHWDGDTCHWTVPISVRNCGPFTMFKLMPVPTCALRYCGSGG